MFFRKALQKGTEIIKNLVVDEVKDYFFHERFDDKDVYDISRGTSKEDELFEYANIPYSKTLSNEVTVGIRLLESIYVLLIFK